MLRRLQRDGIHHAWGWTQDSLPMPVRLRVQSSQASIRDRPSDLPRREMRTEEIVFHCLRDTGARGMSKHSEEVALLGLIFAQLAGKQRRVAMRRAFIQGHPEVGSVFLIIVLPILIQVISAWITRWILNRKDLKRVQADAYDALTALSPSTTATLTSISTPPTKPTEPNEL